jgi:hypothetical protein
MSHPNPVLNTSPTPMRPLQEVKWLMPSKNLKTTSPRVDGITNQQLKYGEVGLVVKLVFLFKKDPD